MEGKSRLPTAIKTKPTSRDHVPSDRVGTGTGLSKQNPVNGIKSTAISRGVLTSFENFNFNFRTGAPVTTAKPTKRHASPEFRGSKTQSVVAKRLRRSRSVSDIDALLSQTQKHFQSRGRPFMMPSAPAPKAIQVIKPPLAPPKTTKITKPTSFKPKIQVSAAPKRLATNSTTTKTDDVSKAKAANTKRIPSYDFKARFHDLSEKHKVLKEKHERLREQLGEFESLPEQYDECRAKLSNLEIEYKAVQEQLATLKQKSADDEAKIKALNDDLNAKIEECRAIAEAKQRITEENSALKIERNDLKTNNVELENETKAQKEMIENLMLELKEAGEQLFRANIERKDLHNTIMDLRGNIRVFCRVRPPLDNEGNRMLCAWQYNDETSLEISSVDANKKVRHDFNFDQVFRPNSMQEDIFELVSPLVQSALDGYNVCIFAYGQTGSGKTFTMDGVDVAPGIIPRTIDLLFDCFEQNKRFGWEFELRAAALEIYNETLFDLLSNEAKDLDIRMVSAKTPTEIFVSNLTEVDVENKNDLHKLMQYAKLNRATAATAGNERSSRSHSVTQLRLFGHHATKNEMTVSTINLIDLAGSESPKTSVRMEETKKINKSLSELTNVIMALLQKQDHIPYRNSKLTHLLMPSLGGNSKTLMFVNVSPFQDCFVETVKSLRFASSVNKCKMSKANKNKIYPNPSPLPVGSTSSTSLNGSN